MFFYSRGTPENVIDLFPIPRDVLVLFRQFLLRIKYCFYIGVNGLKLFSHDRAYVIFRRHVFNIPRLIEKSG